MLNANDNINKVALQIQHQFHLYRSVYINISILYTTSAPDRLSALVEGEPEKAPTNSLLILYLSTLKRSDLFLATLCASQLATWRQKEGDDAFGDLYEIHRAPGQPERHTMYITGLQGDKVSQYSRPDAMLVNSLLVSELGSSGVREFPQHHLVPKVVLGLDLPVFLSMHSGILQRQFTWKSRGIWRWWFMDYRLLHCLRAVGFRNR